MKYWLIPMLVCAGVAQASAQGQGAQIGAHYTVQTGVGPLNVNAFGQVGYGHPNTAVNAQAGAINVNAPVQLDFVPAGGKGGNTSANFQAGPNNFNVPSQFTVGVPNLGPGHAMTP